VQPSRKHNPALHRCTGHTRASEQARRVTKGKATAGQRTTRWSWPCSWLQSVERPEVPVCITSALEAAALAEESSGAHSAALSAQPDKQPYEAGAVATRLLPLATRRHRDFRPQSCVFLHGNLLLLHDVLRALCREMRPRGVVVRPTSFATVEQIRRHTRTTSKSTASAMVAVRHCVLRGAAFVTKYHWWQQCQFLRASPCRYRLRVQRVVQFMVS
jgi:hypothetical protein